MEEYTKEQAVSDFRRLWGKWLAKTGAKSAQSWPEWEDNGGTVHVCVARSPLCQYNFEHGERYCYENCLIVWPKGFCLSSLFGDWMDAETRSERKKLAKQISKLPVNPKWFKDGG